MAKRIISFVLTLGLLCSAFMIWMPVNSDAASYTINGTKIPVAGYPDGGPSYGKSQCWAFTQMVYKKIWNINKTYGYNSYMGTSDDMLRNVAAGADRAITAANTQKFIEAAELGAVIRIASDITGGDSVPKGTRKHSMILVQKDDKGFTVYHSVTSGVYLKYWTWSAFAKNYKNYKYFKYIKWPNAPAFSSKTAPSSVRLTSDKAEGAIGKPITFTASATNASDFTISISGTNYSYTSTAFSTSTTWTPTKAGTYTVKLCARNEIGKTYSSDLKITVYDKKPSAPQISMSASTVVEGQNISIKWAESENVITYDYEIRKDGAVYKKGTTNAGHDLLQTFPKGNYTVKVTAINPFGESTSTATFKVTAPASSGKCGDNAYWSINTETGMLTITGTGEMYDYKSGKTNASGTMEIVHTAPWYIFANQIKLLEICEGITVIGAHSFSYLEKLEYVSLPTTLHTIAERAFLGNSALKGKLYHWGAEIRTSSGLVIPASVQYLGKYAFGNCDSLSDVTFCHAYDNLPQSEGNYSPFSSCDTLNSLSFAGGGGLVLGADKYGYDWSMSIYNIRTFMDLRGGNASNIKNIMQLYGNKYSLPDVIPEKEGYTFVGWFTDPTGGYQVTEETTVIIGVPHNLYARWKAKEYTVSLDLVGGTIVNACANARTLSSQNSNELSISYGSEYGSLPTPELPGSIFAGWSTSPEGGEIITEDTICLLSNDQVLYATWLDADGEDDSEYVEVHAWEDATCTTPKTCLICGETEGPALGHNCATAWNKDSTNHWHTCTVCSVKVDEENHKPGAPATETTPQTCTTCGHIIQPVLNHSHNFATTWMFDDDGHWHACSGCEEKGSPAAHTWDSGTVTKAATCKDAGLVTYSCTDCGATKTEDIATTSDHRYKSEWSKDNTSHWHECSVCKDTADLMPHTPGAEATETTAQTCTTCGYIITPAINHTHNFATTWTTDDINHWHDCDSCEEKGSYASHTWDNGTVTKVATCREAGLITCSCTDCGATKTEDIATTSDHSYKNEWSKDETSHWRECSVCKDIKDLTPHTPGPEATETTAQTCTNCGYIITPAFNHTHDFATTWTTDDINHWHACDGCEEKADLAVHSWDNGLCTICGMSDPNAAQPTDPVPTESIEPTDSAKNPMDSGEQSNNYNLVWVWIFGVIVLATATIGVILYKKKH